MNTELSKPERVREKMAQICCYHFYCCTLWTKRMGAGTVQPYDIAGQLTDIILTHRGKTNQRIDDIMFGHPFGISIA